MTNLDRIQALIKRTDADGFPYVEDVRTVYAAAWLMLAEIKDLREVVRGIVDLRDENDLGEYSKRVGRVLLRYYETKSRELDAYAETLPEVSEDD